MKLKKTDYVVISILIVVVIAGIVGLVVATNLMKENDERDREKRNVQVNLNVVEKNETNIVNTVDTNATPQEQMQQLVNALPNALTNQKTQSEIKSIKIRYAYGYDVALADDMDYIDILEIDCKDEELKTLAQLIQNNKLDESTQEAQTSETTYYNTQIVIDENKVVSFSDKNAIYKHDDKTTGVVLNTELLNKVAEMVNIEVNKKVNTVDPSDIKKIIVTNSSNASVTITDEEEIKTICTLTGCVSFKKDKVNMADQKIVYTLELSNGIKMSIASGGAIGYVTNNNEKQDVKFMFNVEQGLETIFKKYAQ